MSLKKEIEQKYGIANYNSTTKKIAVFDTETLGVTEPRVYDFGLVIADFKGNVYFKKKFIVKEVYSNKKMQTAFYSCKMPKYDEQIANGVFVGAFWEIARSVNQILKDFNVKTLGAFNIGFDERALAFSVREYEFMKEFFNRYHQYDRIDIWTIACVHIGTKPEYHDFCIEHGFYTKAKNIITNAETFYAFITNNPHYEEEHMSVEDCEIEYAILMYVLKEMKGKKPKLSDILNYVVGSPYRLTKFDKNRL